MTKQQLRDSVGSRRQFLQQNAMGIGAVALAWLLKQDQSNAAFDETRVTNGPLNLKPKQPPRPATAQAMISLFMHGGPSHMDLLDPKPELSKRSGEEYTGDIHYSFVNRASKQLLGSPWKFAQHGESGTHVSELLPHLAKIVDDICVVRSMHTGHNGHEVSIRYWHGGLPAVLGRPTLGAWLSYALGTENQSLPAYMVLTDPGGHPVDGVHNWTNGWMPPLFQGTVLRPREPRILNLEPTASLQGEMQVRQLDFLRQLNEDHARRFPHEADLEARIANYELAARMQVEAKDALDIGQESKGTLQLYGIDQPETRDYGTRCLIARRLVERGVRFVQLFLGNQPWDTHSDIQQSLPAVCRRTDQATAALVTDLKQRGLLDSTLVHWGGEIGRLPVTENHGDPKKVGRDHNGQGFSCWLAGGGIQGGMTYGATDEFGHRAVENLMTPNDYQATVMSLFGLDHEALNFLHNGQPQSLTAGRQCRVVYDILSS